MRRLVALWDLASRVSEFEPYDLVAAVEKVCRIPREDFCGPGKSGPAIMAKEMLILVGLQLGASMKVLSEDYRDQFVSTKSTARRGSTESARRRKRQ